MDGSTNGCGGGSSQGAQGRPGSLLVTLGIALSCLATEAPAQQPSRSAHSAWWILADDDGGASGFWWWTKAGRSHGGSGDGGMPPGSTAPSSPVHGLRPDATLPLGYRRASWVPKGEPKEGRISRVSPNLGPPGTRVRVETSSPSDPLHGDLTIDLTIGASPASSSEIPAGWPSPLDPAPDDVDAWFLRTHMVVPPVRDGITHLPGSATVWDTLSGPRARLSCRIEGGEGAPMDVQAFPIDPLTGRLTDPERDPRRPHLRLLLREEGTRTILAESTTEGVGANPRIRVHLPRKGSYIITVETRVPYGNGPCVLDVDLSPTGARPDLPVVSQVVPQWGRPGDTIEITGAFFSPGSRVFVGGVPTPARVLSRHHIQARVPWGALPGPVQVQTQEGLSIFEPDDVTLHLIPLPAAPRPVTDGQPVAVGDVLRGELAPGGSLSLSIDLVAGRSLGVAAYAIHEPALRILGRWRETSPCADLRIRVSNQDGAPGFSITDSMEGPGRNPSIGMSRVYPYTVTTTERSTITLEDEGGDGGPFLLVILDPDEPGGTVPLLTVPLRVNVLHDPDTGDAAIPREVLETQIQQLSVWGQAGILPYVADIRHFIPRPDLFAPHGSAGLRELGALYSEGNHLDVFVVGGLPRSAWGVTTLGVTWTPTGHVFLNGPALAGLHGKDLPFTLAHELGHALSSLPDESGFRGDNLMHGDLSTQTAARLDLEQINRARYLDAEDRPLAVVILSHALEVRPTPAGDDRRAPRVFTR